MPMTIPGGGGGSTSLAALTDVQVTEGAAIDGAALAYNFNTGKWNAGIPSGPTLDPVQTNVNVVLSNGNLTATTGTFPQFNSRATISANTGKKYHEVTLGSLGGHTSFGICNAAFVPLGGNSLGNDANSVAGSIDSNGQAHIIINGATVGSLGATNPGNGDTVGMAVDFTNEKIWFWNPRVNQWNGDVIANQNPATNTGGISISAIMAAQTAFPGVVVDISSITINFGRTAFSNAVPAGFGTWDTFAPVVENVGASPFAFTVPKSGILVVNGGTVTGATMTRGNVTVGIPTFPNDMFPVIVGDVITITYTIIPTLTLFPAF